VNAGDGRVGPRAPVAANAASPLLVLKLRTRIARSDSAQVNSIPSPITPEKTSNNASNMVSD
jgi:hypothetical protein